MHCRCPQLLLSISSIGKPVKICHLSKNEGRTKKVESSREPTRPIPKSNIFKLLQLLWTSDTSLVPTPNPSVFYNIPISVNIVNNHLHCRFYRKVQNQREFSDTESPSLLILLLFFHCSPIPLIMHFLFQRYYTLNVNVPFKFRYWPSCSQSEHYEKDFWWC